MADARIRLHNALSDRYQIERELGQGGMATVYLARDLRHERRVAVKVLRPELAAVIGADRFLQEIKTTANLQHAHILPLHDSGVADNLLYYVMPFVEGESLRDLLNREKQLEIPLAIDLTRQVASALHYAHGKGVIHRDIKPENVMIHDGQALVADFGIALAVSSAAGSSRMTETGMSLGTPQYMSPEQAMGDRELTARSDIYSLGAMLYEMLAGDPPYTGSTAQAIVAKVITEKAVPVTAHRDTVPAHVALAIQKSIAKLPADRFHSAAEFAEALVNPRLTEHMTALTAVTGPAPRSKTRWIWPALAALFAGVAGWSLLLRPGPPPPSVSRYGLLLPPGQEHQRHAWPTFGIAPHGAWLAYVGPIPGVAIGPSGFTRPEQLWVKFRDRFEATPLAGTSGAWSPVASPDGQWVGYLSGSRLFKVPVGGGGPVALADTVQSSVRSAIAWGDDDVLTYIDRAWQLRRVPASGGAAAVAWAPPATRYPIRPAALPEGRGILFTLCNAACQQSDLWVLDLRSGKAEVLIPGTAQGWYPGLGHLLYTNPEGAVFAAPFDLESLALDGAAVPVLDGVGSSGGVAPQLSVAGGGALAYVRAAAGAEDVQEAVWISREGRVTPVDSSWTFDAIGNAGWALSPDGKRLAIRLITEQGNHIWVKELDRGPVSRITFDSSANIRPRWLPDGKTVSYHSVRTGHPSQALFTRRADGTGVEERRLTMNRAIWEAVWSRDGKWLVLRTGGVTGVSGERDAFVMQLGVDTAPRPLLTTTADEKALALSPDGRWLAYESNETGQEEVYVRPFPNVESGKWQVSVSGGRAPLWARSGRELFYLNTSNQMMAAQIPAGVQFSVAERVALFPVGPEYVSSANYTPFDVHPDERRFLMVRRRQLRQGQDVAPLIIVENWLEELKARIRN